MAGGLAGGEVRLYPFPYPDKLRPAVVLTRHSAVGYLSKVTVAPVTPSIRGVPSDMKAPCAVNLFNLVTVSKAQLGPARRPAER